MITCRRRGEPMHCYSMVSACPALVISPYARPGYVDHKFYTFTSVLGFVEKTFGLPPLERPGSTIEQTLYLI